MFLIFQATSVLEIDFGALATSLNCVPLLKRLDISQDGIHVGILTQFPVLKYSQSIFFLDVQDIQFSLCISQANNLLVQYLSTCFLVLLL